MPAFATHYIFAEEMKNFLRDNADFKYHHKAVLIGTQGPDIFFFHHLLNRIKAKSKVGSALHRTKPAEILEAFADYCKFSPNIDIAKSYIYGFILHYVLDRNCHPYVYSFQERIMSKKQYAHHSSVHNRIEASMDTYLLSRRMGIDNPVDFDGASTFTKDIEVIEEIAHLLAFVVPRVTEYSITEADVIRAIDDSRKMQKVFRDKTDFFHFFFRVVETIFAPIIGYFKFSSMIKPKDLEKAKKYGNINNKPWKSPYDDSITHTESFEDLFDFSLLDAKKIIQGLDKLRLGYLTGYEITHNISFLTGIEVK